MGGIKSIHPSSSSSTLKSNLGNRPKVFLLGFVGLVITNHTQEAILDKLVFHLSTIFCVGVYHQRSSKWSVLRKSAFFFPSAPWRGNRKKVVKASVLFLRGHQWLFMVPVRLRLSALSELTVITGTNTRGQQCLTKSPKGNFPLINCFPLKTLQDVL